MQTDPRIRRDRKRRPKRLPASARPGPGELAYADTAAIDEHLKREVGPIDAVLHELESQIVHVDIHVLEARPERPFHVLATSGMSALSMTVPQRVCDCPPIPDRTELALALPKSWALTGVEARARKWSWPIRWLLELARYPHRYETFFDVGHTMGMPDPDEAYIEGTSYAGAILAWPGFVAPTFDYVSTSLGLVRFLMPIPLFAIELEYKLEHGGRALLDRLRERSPSAFGPLNLARMPVV